MITADLLHKIGVFGMFFTVFLFIITLIVNFNLLLNIIKNDEDLKLNKRLSKEKEDMFIDKMLEMREGRFIFRSYFFYVFFFILSLISFITAKIY